MKRALKETQTNVQIKENQFKPGGEQRIRAASVGSKTPKQIPARQGKPEKCQIISMADGEAAAIHIL